MKQGAEYLKWQPPPSFDLSTSADTADTPVAEVLTIVSEQPISVLAETRAGAPDNLARRKVRLGMSDGPHWMTVDKLAQRHLLHRSALPEPREARVMDDLAAADVQAMVVVSTARGDQMSSQSRFLLET